MDLAFVIEKRTIIRANSTVDRRGQTSDVQRWLGRVFWLALLLMHVAALPMAVSALAAPADIASQVVTGLRFAGLVLSIVAFVLKIIDVRWLRIAPGWRSVVLAVLVVALLHVGVVERAMHGDAMFDPAHLGLVLIAGSAWRIAASKRSLSRLFTHIRSQHRRRTSPLVLYRLNRVDIASPFEAMLSSICVPRAPPRTA